MRKPRALRRGDTIGIVAPSSLVDAELLKRGVAVIEARGYRVALGEHVLARAEHCDYLAGRDADRAADLNAMFARSDVAAVFCARGGSGSARLLDLLDRDVIAANPKIFLGYSDITSLHLMLARQADLVTFHGKMACGLDEMDATAMEVFWRVLERPEPFGTLPADPETMETLVPGVVEGELAGGCLSILSHAVGTPDAPDFRDKIVLIEDVGEPIYRADRCLTQLRNAGLLQQAAGFVVGRLTRWQEHEKEGSCNTPSALWKDILAPLGKPAITGFSFGHEPNPLTLPLGVRVRLDASVKTLALLESATRTDVLAGEPA
jgi:muramoyltetrapeptide carboxypeptidase